MKVMLFFGAGISVPSRLPVAAELTEALFEPASAANEENRAIRALLGLLREHDSADRHRPGLYRSGGMFKASGAIYRGNASTYEDLYFLCQQMALWSNGLTDNAQTTSFMETIERQAGDWLDGTDLEERMYALGKLGQPACTYIEAAVAKVLRRQYIAGLDLLGELASDPAIEELNIVTLNHDTLVEQFCIANQIDFTDGFGAHDGDVRWHDDTVYDEGSARVRLFKLHGSVDWYEFMREGRWRTAVLTGNDPANARNKMGERLRAKRLSPSFLSGLDKATAYHRGVYADGHFRFLELLRHCDRMIMSGYGWGDMAMNFQLETWLDSALEARLILLHEDPAQLIERNVIMAASYETWRRTERLAVLEKWFADTGLAEVRDLLT